MNKKSFALLILSAFLTACSSVFAPPTALPTLTPTAFIPLERGTPLPPIYQPIHPNAAASLNLLARWKSDVDLTKRLAFMPEGDKLLIELQLWNVFDGTLEGDLKKSPSELNNNDPLIAYSPDGQFFATATGGWSLVVTATALPKRVLVFYLDDIVGSTFLPDSQNIAIFMSSGEIWFVSTDGWMPRLEEVEDGGLFGSTDLLPDLVVNVGSRPEEVVFSKDGSTMAVVDEEKNIQIWDVSTLMRRFILEDTDQSTHLALSPNGQIVAFGSADRLLRLWDTRTGKMLISLEGHAGNVKSLAFSPNGLLLASVDDNYEVYIWGVLPDADPLVAAPTATAFAQLSASPTGTRVSLPSPTVTPTSILPVYSTLPWPVAAPTGEQIAEVRQCDVEGLAQTRYPEKLSYWEIEAAYSPESACDWAVVAVAYQNHQRDKESVSEEGKRAFFQAVKLNLGFALHTDIFYNYFGNVELVSVPDLSRQTIQRISIDYQWSGIGEPSEIEYTIEIAQADLPEKMEVSVTTQPQDLGEAVNENIDPALVQAVGLAMVNFVPVQSFFTLQPCTDNLPDWKADITFSDGTSLELITNASNLMTLGGPWQVQIDGQNYVQFSPDLLAAFYDLFDALGLPLGEPMGMFCAQVNPFELAYP